MIVCVHIYITKCVWGSLPWSCVDPRGWWLECLPQLLFPFCFFWNKTSHWTWDTVLARLNNYRATGSACLWPPSPGITYACYHTRFLNKSYYLNSGSHSYAVNTLSTETYPQPWEIWFLVIDILKRKDTGVKISHSPVDLWPEIRHKYKWYWR